LALRLGPTEDVVADIKYIDLRKGMVFVGEDGQLYLCLDRDLNTPGNWRAILQLKIKNLKTGSIVEKRFRPEDKVDLAFLDRRNMTFSYREGDDFYFTDTDTFEQESLSKDLIGEDNVKLIRDNDECQVVFYEGKALSIELPATVTMKVIETEPSIKGATAAAQYKKATMETGLVIDVPPFINIGELIDIDTREVKYLKRSKE
jgi:elongation factor P